MSDFGNLQIAVHPGSAALFLAAEELRDLARISRTPAGLLTADQEQAFYSHPLRRLASNDPDQVEVVEHWLRGLAQVAYKEAKGAKRAHRADNSDQLRATSDNSGAPENTATSR